VTLQEVKEILIADVITGHNKMNLEVREAGCTDFMSDLLVYGKAGMLLITGLTNSHVVHAANAVSAAAIVVVNGRCPSVETIRTAETLQIPILSTKYILFEAVGRLYTGGMVGNLQKVVKS
jgi:predicted transcriptional regulator